MKRVTLFSVLLVLFALFALFVQFAIGADPYDVRIKQILDRPYDLAMETVKLKGKVIKFEDVKAASTRVYILRDKWGDEIKIITNNAALPEVNLRYLVTGIVFVDNTDKENPEVKIVESSRETTPNDQKGDNSQYTSHNPPGKKNEKLVNILFGAAAVILVVIAILAVLMISGKYKESFTPAWSTFPGLTDSGLTGAPDPSRYIEDSSIKFAAPPDGTLKLLTVRLEILAGFDQFKDIRFYKNPSQEETEFTFGREPGTPYVHIQLKSPTVSAKHAKMLWTNGKYMLLNYSTTNPTKVNGNTLDKDQSVTLEDNSTIEMGEIILKFHEK